MNFVMDQIKAGSENLRIIHYPFVDEKLKAKLDKLRFRSSSRFTSVFEETISKGYLQAVVAVGSRGGIRGWAGIYKDINYSHRWRDFDTEDQMVECVGVFVKEEYRHLGIGGKVRETAINIAHKQGHNVWWYNAKLWTWFELKNEETKWA